MTLKTLLGSVSRLIVPVDTPDGLLVEMSKAALADRDFDAGAAGLALDRWIRKHDSNVVIIPRPKTDRRTLVACAALIELFAERVGSKPPAWTAEIGGLDEPFYFFPLARTNTGFREELERQTPEPLRKRNLFSTKNYLNHV
jgi:hypothetical protein